LAHLYDPGCNALLDRIREKAKSESSGPRRGEMPEVVAASGSTGTILPKLPYLSGSNKHQWKEAKYRFPGGPN
jgi:hypothetical protein